MRFCLVGKEIAYSLSPIIHNHHFKKLGIHADYEIFDVDNINRNVLMGYNGFNVTIPYKEKIIKYCDVLSEEAQIIQAVNCIKVCDNKFYGFNTDIYGFYMLLKRSNLLEGSKKVLIIGAGGAGKAVYYTFKKYTNHEIFVTNRTLLKAKKLTENIILFEEVQDFLKDFDIVVNSTNVCPIEIKDIKKDAHFIDINYLSNSLFLERAKKLNAKTINGLDMLIYQAVKSFEIWFNKKANDKLMYEALERM